MRLGFWKMKAIIGAGNTTDSTGLYTTPSKTVFEKVISLLNVL
jgi:hypothetical protein